MSILPLSVSAACSHSYTKVYTMENANMHSYKSKCTKCGTITEGYGYSGWLDHTFNSYGKCTACGYCKHSSTRTVYAYENGNMHSYYATCNGCGQKLEGYGYSGWSNHSFSGNTCSQCGYTKSCSHSSTSTKYSNLSSTQHKYWTHCNSCGIDYNYVTTSHSWSYGSWSATSDTSHKRSKSCTCGASSSETGSHYFSGNSCTSCGYTKVSTPVVTASVSLSASGPSGTLGSAGGEIASESYPASYTVSASASGCSVTKIVYTLNGRSYTSNGSSVTITANTQSDFQTSTFTAYTSVSGVTATFTVNFKYVRKASSQVMWETSQEAVIRSITGNGLNKSLSYSMTIPNSYDSQGNLTASQIATIQSLIGRNDGKTYTVNYTRTIWVYTPAEYSSTGQKQILGTFDGNSSSDIATCLSRWGWNNNTKSAIQQAASSSLTFTTGLSTDCTAIWIDSSTGKQLYSKTFGSGTVSNSSSKVVSVSYSEYSGSSNYVYEKLTYSGDTSGTSTSQTYSQTYTSTSKPLTVTFYCHPKAAEVTTGTITVYVRDAETNALISGASVSGAGKSGTTGSGGSVKFTNIALGTYTFSASKTGYNSGTGKSTITAAAPTTTVTIYLTKNTPIEEEDDDYPVTGSITVYVRDASTYALLSSAYVSGGGYGGYTNSSGYVSFSGMSFGSYTFSASKSGYYSNSGSTTISSTNSSRSITIYLTPIEEEEDDSVYGYITVYVYDANTGAAISDATVSGAGTTRSTNSYGYTTYSGLDIGSYYFTASKSGYSSGSGSTTITASSTSRTVYIYLTPEVIVPTTGSITVYVKDSDTGAYISGATISGDGSGTTNSSGYVSFSGLSFGSYNFSASKSGYYAGSGSATISSSSTSKSVTIYLTPIPTSGTITVYVKDASTGAAISGASVSGGGVSGSTNTSGYVSFSGLSFGSYTFSASKSGYSSGSGSASISTSATTNSVTIYLTKLPTSGSITVTVRDKDTNAVLSGATVSGGGYSGTTGSSGTVSFTTMPFTTYTFTASKSGYDSNTGSATISATDATKSITIYLSKKKADVGVVAEAVDGTVYRGSTIMVSADVYGDAAIDFTPDNPLTVTMKATRNGGTVFDTQTKSVICPKGDTNLVWFTVDIPETGYTSADVTFTFMVTTPATITDTASTNDVSSKTVTTYVLPDRSTPDASFELDPPADFTDSTYKTNNNKELTWFVWEWNGGFVEKTYTAKLTVKAELTPDATAVWSKYNNARKLWTTRSGYGLNTAVTVSLTGVDDDMFAGNAKVNAYYPEFNYSTSAGKSNMLLMGSENESGYSASFTFDANTDTISGNKMHVTPVWFPDGEYSVKYEVYDIWTPAGMLTSNTYAIINIEGSMYDDYYTQRN